MGNRDVRRRARLASIICGALMGTASALDAQLPNYGNYTGLGDLFRVGVQVTNAVNGFSQQARFGQGTIHDLDDYLDPENIATYVGFANAQQAAVAEIYDIRGLPALAGYAQNSTTLTVRFVKPDGTTLTQKGGAPCTFTYTGATREESYEAFDDETGDPSTPTGKALIRCISRGFARTSPVDPIAGNPQSLEATLARGALDLSSGDSLAERGGGANSSGDPWIVGAVYTGGSAGRFDTKRVDARIARSFRVFEGSRALLKFDLPFNYTRIGGANSYSAEIGLGLEMPLIERRWSLEPRLGYGIVYSAQQGSVGHIAQATLASRYVIDGIGRGRLVIGNLVGYGQTLGTPATNYNLNPDIKNWSLRNGLAYELPLKFSAGGRLASLRASYTYTRFLGDTLFSNDFHEMTLSFGLRGREESVRATRDLIRFNVTAIEARRFHSISGGIGFRF